MRKDSLLKAAQSRAIKELANWQCTNSDCKRNCIRAGEHFGDFIDRIGDEYWMELRQDIDTNPYSRSVRMQAFRMVVVERQALCAPCALALVRPHASGKTLYWQRERRGQLPLNLYGPAEDAAVLGGQQQVPQSGDLVLSPKHR